MRKIVTIALVAIICSGVSGCMSVHDQRFSGPLGVDPVDAKFEPIVMLADNQPKEQSSATLHSLLGFISWGPNRFADGVAFNKGFMSSLGIGPFELTKRAAAYNLCQKTGADILVAPRYTVTTKNYIIYSKVEAVVEAFPAKLTGVKLAKKID